MCDWKSERCSVVSDSLRPHGLYSPWNSSGQSIEVGSCSFLQGIFPTQGSNPGLPHCRQILYQLRHQGIPRILELVAYPFSYGSSWPSNATRVSCIAGGFFTSWTTREVHNKSIDKYFLFQISRMAIFNSFHLTIISEKWKHPHPFSILSLIIWHSSWAVFFNITLLLQETFAQVKRNWKEMNIKLLYFPIDTIKSLFTLQDFLWKLCLKTFTWQVKVLNHHTMNLTQTESISTQFWREALLLNVACAWIYYSWFRRLRNSRILVHLKRKMVEPKISGIGRFGYISSQVRWA